MYATQQVLRLREAAELQVSTPADVSHPTKPNLFRLF
jgi:hypothetical protein